MYHARAKLLNKIDRKNKKKIVFAVIAIVVFAVFGLETFYASKAQAANGINKQINFQGKLVNSNGTNVTDGLYDMVFKIYTVPSGGAAVWTETRNGGNQVTVNQGIFRVSLGSVTTLPGSVDFNTDNIYLGIAVGADSEMTPRVQFASVPQAFNAEKVNGLTVTNTSDAPFGSATTLKIADGKTVVISNGLTFTGTDTTSFAFPSSGGNIVTEAFTQTLTNKTIGSTGLVFSAAATDITTVTNEHLNITPNGTGRVGINTAAPLASFDVQSNGAGGGTLAIASVSGSTSFAGLVVDNSGVGDIFTASKAGAVKFVIENSGNIKVTANQTIDTLTSGTLGIGTSNATTLSIGRSGQGITVAGFDCSGFGNQGKLTTTSGGVLTCAADASGGGSGSSNWVLNSTNGTLSPINNTLDFLWGGTSSSSALFKITGNSTFAGTTSAASVSANTSFAALLVDNRGVGDLFTASTSGLTRFTITNNGTASSSAGFTINGAGNLQTTKNQTLTIGGGTTGFITLDSGSGKVNILDNTSISGTLTDLTGLTLASGPITLGGVTGDTLCLKGGATASWGACGSGAAGTWDVNTTLGTHTPGNNTLDLLIGGTSTQSAMFSVLGIAAGTNPSASVSAQQGANATKGIYMSGDGSLQSVRNNTLTIGGDTTGDIYVKPRNSTGMVRLIHGSSGSGGLMLGDSETDATSKIARIKSYAHNSGSSLPITMMLAWNQSSTNGLYIGGGSGTEYASTDIHFRTALTTSTANGTDRLYIGSDGLIAVGGGNNTPLATLDVRAQSGTLSVASVSGATSFAGLVVDNSGVGDIFTASSSGMTRFTVKQNGVVQIGSTTNGLTFDYLNGGPTFTGTGRPTKKIALSAEYAGAVLTASGSATTNGSMTSDASSSAALSNWMNYYEWSSTQTSLQDYTVAVRVHLPQDFSAWATTNAITISYNTELVTTDSQKLDVIIYNADTSLTSAQQATPVVYRQNAVSATQKTWLDMSIDDSDLTDNGNALDAAGDIMVIYLKMSSKNSNHVQVGNIVLSYLSKF